MSFNPINSEKSKRRAIKEHHSRWLTYEEQKNSRKQYLQEKTAQVQRNKEALLYFIDCIRDEFTPEQVAILDSSIIPTWQKRRYTREATLAYHDVKRALGSRYSNDEIDQRVGKCQKMLRVFMSNMDK